MASPTYNNFLANRLYGIFTYSGKRAQAELLIYLLIKTLRTSSTLHLEPIFYVFSLISYIKSPIEFLKKKKGRKRRIYYIPKPVSFRRQLLSPIRFLQSCFKEINDYARLPQKELLANTVSDFFLKDWDFFKDYKHQLDEDATISRINRKRRWK